MMQNSGQVDLISDEAQDRELIAGLADHLRLRMLVYPNLRSYVLASPPARWIISKLTLSDGHASELMRLLRSREVDIPIVFLRSTESIAEVSRIYKYGFHHVLQAPVAALDLLAILQDETGETQRSTRLSQSTLDAHRKLSVLDSVDRRILDAAIHGLPDKTTALRLDMSLRTLERKRCDLIKKLGLNSSEEMIALGVRCEYASVWMPMNMLAASATYDPSCLEDVYTPVAG